MMKLNEKQGLMLVGAIPALSLGLGLGLALGLFMAQKKLEKKYLEISNKEIAEAKQFYSLLHKKDEFKSPESAVETLGLRPAVEALQRYQGEKTEEVRVIETFEVESVSIDASAAPNHGSIEIVSNIFTDAKVDDSFDYEEELKNRTEFEPYVISHDEFMEGEADHSQVTLTYYVGDSVLTDEREEPIDDIDNTIGGSNLQRFGHGSKDSKIVYIRNDRLDLDFEVVRSTGKYAEEVLGFIEHSDRSDRRPKLRKFRGDDE